MSVQRTLDATTRECFEISRLYREGAAAHRKLSHQPSNQVNSWDAVQEREAEKQAEEERLQLEYQRGGSQTQLTQTQPPRPEPPPAAVEPPATRPPPGGGERTAMQRWGWPLALLAAAGTAGTAGYLVANNSSGSTNLPSSSPTPNGVERDGEGALQWLEEEGLHLPPNGNGYAR